MRTDVLDLHSFYASALGATARRFIAGRLLEAWRDRARLRIAGFGHAEPYLEMLDGADARIGLSPAGQGVARWPAEGPSAAALVADHHWPLPDASIDRLLIVHGLEEASKPRQLLREAWRVLADDGRLIVIAAHRRGPWSMVETTPFAAGRPYLRGQIDRLLTDAAFRPESWTSALYFPPIRARFMVRAARAWERAGGRLWPWFGGVIMVEAHKDFAQPVAIPLKTHRGLAHSARPSAAAAGGLGARVARGAPPRGL